MPESFDTPDLGREWCPKCEPRVDPFREIVVEVWCHRHAPETRGSADDAVTFEPLTVQRDMEAETNRVMCAFLHRGILPPRKKKS